ncbi:MAG: MGMT family protein [Eubacteriales bacterium]|nr:MGMT family protein [Eubacteriales bacterium]
MNFYDRIKYVATRIPYGKVATYGQIAMLCGKPKNARQVGYALGHNLAGDEIPAHRIVNRAGLLSGAGAFETPDMQRKLLAGEGVDVVLTDKGWKINLKEYGWYPSMETAEKFYQIFKEE